MNSPLDQLIPALSMALLHSIWQCTLIALLTAIGLYLLRGASAKSRYLLASLALVLCVALPLAYLLGHLDRSPAASVHLPALVSEIESVGTIEVSTLPNAMFGQGLWNPWAALSSTHVPPSLMLVLVSVWTFGVILMTLRLWMGLRWVDQHVRLGQQQSDVFLQGKLNKLAARVGIHRHISLGLSNQISSPVTAGWWRPIVIVPTALVSGMPPDLLEALLAHEVAHIKRMDYLLNLFQSAIEIVLFYHPAIWWLSRQIRIEREQIADDLAAGLLGEPRRLALALSELERFQFTTPQLAQAAHGGNLMSRIKRLINPETSKVSAKSLGWKLSLPFLGLSTVCLMLYAQANTTPMPKPSLSPAATHTPVTEESTKPVQHPAKIVQKQVAAKVANSNNEDLNYSLVKMGEQYSHSINGDQNHRKELKRLKETSKDEFLWFSEKGRSFIIKDKDTLAQASAAYQPMENVSAQMEVHGKKMEEQGQVMEEIGRKMEVVADRAEQHDRTRDSKLQALEDKLEAQQIKVEIAAQGLATAKTQEEKAQARLRLQESQEKIHTISQKMHAEAEKIAAKQQKLHASLAPLEELGKKMQEASAPMTELSETMSVYSNQINELAKQADLKVKELIQAAKQKGLAIPVSGS